jgi:hypothetical protein
MERFSAEVLFRCLPWPRMRMLDCFNEGWIKLNGGSLDGGAGDRFRNRDQLGVELACGFSDVGLVEAAHKGRW